MVKRDLEGIRLMLTRPHSISGGSQKKSSFLVQQLELLGAEVFLLKALKIEEASDQFAMENAILNFGEFDWIAFTSANGFEMTAKKMRQGRLRPLDTSATYSYIACSTRACGRQSGGEWTRMGHPTSEASHE